MRALEEEYRFRRKVVLEGGRQKGVSITLMIGIQVVVRFCGVKSNLK